MKNILIIAVNYHSYDALRDFLKSVDVAAQAVKELIQVDVVVADNTEKKQHIENTYTAIHALSILPLDTNMGYLGGALAAYNKWAHNDYEYISISNIDLQVASDFFEQLYRANIPYSIGWIAPNIYTPKIHRHENPYMYRRPTKYHFLKWKIIYSNTLIYRLYHWLYSLKSSHQTIPDNPCIIYAGHGSFMLFTKAFTNLYPTLSFPSFMYGEEIYLAELMRAKSLQVLYVPQLMITNDGNINTHQIALKRKCRWSKNSISVIEKCYFT